MKTSYTIKDIAEMAEVSRATVDRVIHGRGVVSKETANKINNILAKIDYEPNFLAQTLKNGIKGKIAVLIPDSTYDVYWKRVSMGVSQALNEYSFIGMKVDTFLFNPYKSASFTLNSKLILKEGYDGIVLVPFFYNESVAFTRKCDDAGIPYIFFNTNIKESNPLCFVGQDLIESGKTAAHLMHMVTKDSDKIAILHLDEDISNAKHMQEKELGFKEYFTTNCFSKDKIIIRKIGKITEIDKLLGELIKQEKHLGGLFVSTSKVHFIADFLKEYNVDIKLIGYDFIMENISYLRDGVIDFLLFQNPKSQSRQALSLLIKHLAFNNEIKSEKILPTSIVIKENIESYLIDFQ